MLCPTFILGCGRSGTTILGKSLSRHSQIKYLNEPRALWLSAYPQTDIWSSQALERQGKLDLYESDAVKEKTNILIAAFERELSESGKKVLIEKLPINNFRVRFINEIFPKARYIYIWRNGCEVARSIEQLCLQGEWYAGNDYKWDLLVNYAKKNSDTAHLPEMCDTYYLKGLLEWRLSVSAATEFLDSCSKDQYVSLGYGELTNSPMASIGRIFNFLGIAEDKNVWNFLDREIRPQNRKFWRDLSVLEREIGGIYLEKSLELEREIFSADDR